MRELIVVRHGETAQNAAGLFTQGMLAHPLTEIGREEAAAAARLIRSHGWQAERLITSPLRRCMETAEILQVSLGLPAATQDPAFTEIDPGSLTGLSWKEIEAAHPKLAARPANTWRGFAEFGGESQESMFARVAAGLDAFPNDARVLLVTHGGVFKAILAHLLDLSSDYFLGLRPGSCLRLALKRRGASEVMALTHLMHASEWAAARGTTT
ncbi:MAG: histidine phosphatase family protein [Planctomycetota bacterium]